MLDLKCKTRPPRVRSRCCCHCAFAFRFSLLCFCFSLFSTVLLLFAFHFSSLCFCFSLFSFLHIFDFSPLCTIVVTTVLPQYYTTSDTLVTGMLCTLFTFLHCAVHTVHPLSCLQKICPVSLTIQFSPLCLSGMWDNKKVCNKTKLYLYL